MVSTCRSKNSNKGSSSKGPVIVIASENLQGKLRNMEVVDFDGRPHKAVAFQAEKKGASKSRWLGS